MAAKDYEFACGWQNAYLTKKLKSNEGKKVSVMSNDRRVITDNEIIYLLKWYAQRECEKLESSGFALSDDKGEVIHISLKGEWLKELSLEDTEDEESHN